MNTIRESVKGRLQKYMMDPLKEPLTNPQQEINHFIKVTDDSTRKSRLLTTFDGNENPYHTAARHQNIKVIEKNTKLSKNSILLDLCTIWLNFLLSL